MTSSMTTVDTIEMCSPAVSNQLGGDVIETINRHERLLEILELAEPHVILTLARCVLKCGVCACSRLPFLDAEINLS